MMSFFMPRSPQSLRLPQSSQLKPPLHPMRCAIGGFTLVEVLVALAIVAVALAAGARAAGALINNSERQQEVMFAQWCAENALVEVRLLPQLPSIGTNTRTCSQAGRDFTVDVVTSGTVNPALRRVDARVRTDAYFVLSLSTLVGRF